MARVPMTLIDREGDFSYLNFHSYRSLIGRDIWPVESRYFI